MSGAIGTKELSSNFRRWELGRLTTLIYKCQSRGEQKLLLDFGNRNGKFHSRLSGTGIPRKIPFPIFRNGNSIGKFNSRLSGIPGKFPGIPRKIPFPIFGNGNANRKFHSQFSEWECEWKILFLTFGTGIRGQYSRKWPGTGIPAHP